jgi:DNA-binding MarR family transcriptional regulator
VRKVPRGLCPLQKRNGPGRAQYREHFEVSTIVHIKSFTRLEMKSEAIVCVPAEADLLGTQARELSAGIARLAEVILANGLLCSEPDTTLHEARALDLLGRKPLWSMGEFARELSVTLSTASHTADKLVRKRAVKRSRSQHDRRLVFISLSGRGLRRHDALFQNKVRICTGILEQLSPAEREITLSAIRRLAGIDPNAASTQRIEQK